MSRVRKSRAKPRKLKNCDCCGSAFTAVRPEAIYCGNACKVASFKERMRPDRRRRTALKRLLTTLRRVVSAKIKEERASRLGARKPKAAPTCKNCGGPMPAIRPFRRHCSETCRAIGRDSSRAAAKVRERLRYGKSGYSAATRCGGKIERVSRIKVFDAAGWKCRACGVDTPRSLLKDSRHRDAPTLDHIVPKSMGGDHTYENLQCLCRSCNSKKGVRMHPVVSPRPSA